MDDRLGRRDEVKAARQGDPGTIEEEVSALLAAGAGAGNRAGMWAFLAFLILAAAVLHFYFSDSGGNSFLLRLDADLLAQARLSLAAAEAESRLVVTPSWPFELYWSLRREMFFYLAAVSLAAVFGFLSVRSRARRDAYLAHERFSAELARLRPGRSEVSESRGDGQAKG
ncbi:MAG: hypothetical protein LBU64_01150 [Planctomycetota bacterium]|jgi:hypothetical protein|nr:hypothetical protein [Planctomycetota bacterium]